jgi:hypothetical protein
MQHNINTNQAADDIYGSLERSGVFTSSICRQTLPPLLRGYYYKRLVASLVGFE